jgi:hypothetical protein
MEKDHVIFSVNIAQKEENLEKCLWYWQSHDYGLRGKYEIYNVLILLINRCNNSRLEIYWMGMSVHVGKNSQFPKPKSKKIQSKF